MHKQTASILDGSDLVFERGAIRLLNANGEAVKMSARHEELLKEFQRFRECADREVLQRPHIMATKWMMAMGTLWSNMHLMA